MKKVAFILSCVVLATAIGSFVISLLAFLKED